MTDEITNLIIEGIPEDSDFHKVGEWNIKVGRPLSALLTQFDTQQPNAIQRINGIWHNQRWEQGRLLWSEPSSNP